MSLQDLFSSPNLINYILLVLYVVNIIWLSYHGNYWQVTYWMGATILTVGVIGGIK